MFYGAGIGRDCFTGKETWYVSNEAVDLVKLWGPTCEKCKQAASSDNLPRLMFTGKKTFYFPDDVVGAEEKWMPLCTRCYDEAITTYGRPVIELEKRVKDAKDADPPGVPAAQTLRDQILENTQ